MAHTSALGLSNHPRCVDPGHDLGQAAPHGDAPAAVLAQSDSVRRAGELIAPAHPGAATAVNLHRNALATSNPASIGLCT